MHELALSQSVVDLVTERAACEGLSRVTRVVLEIGVAAAVEPEALRFCFDVVTRQTRAHGAELVIDTVALRAKCIGCGGEFCPAAVYSACPACGGFERNWLGGQELRVKSFDGE